MKFMLALSFLFSSSFLFASSISIMNYNVENLFDTLHDKGKNDYTWMPLSVKQASPEIQQFCSSIRIPHYRRNCFELDWSEEVLKAKILNLAKVIKSYNQGRGADIIVFQEVENKRVLKQLVDIGLKGMGYKYISLIEGPDTRGIDIGMISRLPILSETLHKVDISEAQRGRTTRGILEVKFKLGNKHITVFGNHWPSQGNNDKTRLIASEVLSKLIRGASSHLVLATGDFNQTKNDYPHGINQNILPLVEDVEELGRKDASETSPGTHWYRGVWESLDRIFISKKSLQKTNIYPDYNSFDIIDMNFMVTDLEWTDFDSGTVYYDENIPWRYNSKKLVGFSDHLPVAITINL